MDARGTALSRLSVESRHVVSAAGPDGAPRLAPCDGTEAIARRTCVPDHTGRCRSVEAVANLTGRTAARGRTSSRLARARPKGGFKEANVEPMMGSHSARARV